MPKNTTNIILQYDIHNTPNFKGYVRNQARYVYTLLEFEHAFLNVHRQLYWQKTLTQKIEETYTKATRSDGKKRTEIVGLDKEMVLCQDRMCGLLICLSFGLPHWNISELECNFSLHLLCLIYYGFLLVSHAAVKLGQTLFPLFALALDLPENFFDNKVM